MFEKYCVSEMYTIREVLNQFENNHDRVAIVINPEDKVIGVVSQGDVLRALSSGIDIYTQITQIIQSSFLHLYEKNFKEAYNIFKARKITLLPIIDRRSKLTGIITLDDIFNYLENRDD